MNKRSRCGLGKADGEVNTFNLLVIDSFLEIVDSHAKTSTLTAYF
jgi:hypothetical protein